MYYPKSAIVENLYTSGGEFQLLKSSEEFIGFYHKFNNGKFFTGKTNNVSPRYELVPYIKEGSESRDQLAILDTKDRIALFLGDPDPVVNQEEWDQGMVMQYLKIKQLPTNDDNPRDTPQFYYPNPTKEDYEKTYFIRYFANKINVKNEFIEIDKETYEKLKDQDKKWSWEKYAVFKVIWTIVAETEEKVSTINRNMLYLKQRDLRQNGLIALLRGNYSKFFKSIAQLKLENAPKQVQEKSLKDPIPNTKPIPPSISSLRSEKYFKNKKFLQEKRAEFENEKFKRKTSLSQNQIPSNQKSNQQVGLEQEALKEGSVDSLPTSSPSNQQTSRNTGGY